MEYIEFTIIGKHIVCRRSGVIADNTDYMMRFAFDEGWADYPDKTVLVLDNESKIYELHLTGGATEVRLPKFIGRKLLAVGVTATAGDGEISTDAVSLRVNPSIRTGASEVIESPESGAKDMLEEYRQKYDALIAELQAAIDSTYLGVTGAEVGQTVRITAVDDDGNPTGWEAVDFPEQIQTDYEQTDETAADYLKNRPFGNVAYDGIFFKRVPGGYNLVRVPGFNALANIQGSRKAEIWRNGNVINTGSANVSVSDYDGSISIKYTSAQTIIRFSGSYGTLNMINVQWDGGISNEGEYVLHIDGLYYEEYIKLSADKVDGTLPYASASDYIPLSVGSGYSNYRAKALSSVIPILGVSGASVGQIVKIKSVDSSGKPTAWEAIDMPAEAFTINLTMADDESITADKTFAEIKEAYDNGKIVMARFMETGSVPLVGIDDSHAIFQVMLDNRVAVVKCESQDGSDTWDFAAMDMATAADARSLGMSGASVGQIIKVKEVNSSGRPTKWEAATDSTPFIVEFGGTGAESEPYTSSHTYDQIAAAVSAGRYVIGYAGLLGVDGDPAMGRYGIYFNLTSIQDMAVFEFIDANDSYKISAVVLSPSEISIYGSYLDAKSYRYGGVKADDAEETDTQPVRKGADGKLYTSKSLGITGATAGQIIKVKSVDASGNPTEWESVDFSPATVKTWTAADLEETT